MELAASPTLTHYVFSDITGVADKASRDDHVGIAGIMVSAERALMLDRGLQELKDGLYPKHDPLKFMLHGTELASGRIGHIGDEAPPPYESVFSEVLKALNDANVRVIHESLSKKAIRTDNTTDVDMRDQLWNKFLTGCDRALEFVGGNSMAMIVHDRDNTSKIISGILSAHVKGHAGCRMSPPMMFHRSLSVNALQGADIVAYIERHAHKSRIFEEWHKSIMDMR